MKYAILRAVHPNARYEASLDTLGLAETACILRAFGVEESAQYQSIGGLKALVFSCDATERLQQALLTCSSLYALCETDGVTLRPLMEHMAPQPFYDLPSIQKYKGKTNESFTRFLINMALYSSDYAAQFDEKLTLFDPMCGRGTTLFCALGRGYDACGCDLDETSIREAETFLKTYLKNGRYKHEFVRRSETLRAKEGAVVREFFTAPDAEAYRAGKKQRLALCSCDSGAFAKIFKKTPAHLMVADLPYGVQHSGDQGKRGTDMIKSLRRLLPLWKEALRAGGAVAVSFNSYTLKRETVWELMQEAGLCPLTGGVYDNLRHYVEQAVMRDVAVALRR